MRRFLRWLRRFMKRTKGDVRVIGMVAGTHVIEDLQRDVPHRSLVIIPEAQALMSKDLWRGISQGCLMQLDSAPYPTGSLPQFSETERARLEGYCKDLEGHVLRLQNENDALKRQLAGSSNAHAAKLDEILRAIQAAETRVVQVPQRALSVQAPQLSSSEGGEVDGAAPTFLPARIVPDDCGTRINVKGEESASGGVSEAADRLRALRKRSQ